MTSYDDIDSIQLRSDGSIVNAESVSLYQSYIESTALFASTLHNSRFTDCTFTRADLSNATWTDTRIIRAQFKHCKLLGFDAQSSTLQDLHLNNCKGPDMHWRDTTLTRVRFDQSQLQNLDLTGATIESLTIHNSDARNLRLLNTRITHLDLRGSLIEGLIIDPAAMHPKSLQSITIDPTQAPAFTQALGVRIEQSEPNE
ncbi:MAG: pentapeptide repeat-containing protein [Phycisphaerales bacterium]|nr:pentapeptide repeat-containing protein [Phycisphaerales bacterium]